MSDLYRLVYASKNLLTGTDVEVSAAVTQILETSQRNNRKVEVTGALMFNAGAFAQVLEGPRRAVEATFERIQRDLRHSDVTVLQCGPAEGRGFPNWSMAFVGHSAKGQALWDDISARSGFDTTRLDGDQVFSVLRDLVLDEEGVAPMGVPQPTSRLVEPAPVSGLDVDRVTAELLPFSRDLHGKEDAGVPASSRSDAKAEAAVGSEHTKAGGRGESVDPSIALAVCRAALSSERQRTTELREQVDELQIALAGNQARFAVLQDERDLWAERARVLATLMCEEAKGSAGNEAQARRQPTSAKRAAG